MAIGTAQIDINGSADDVWSLVGDFGGIAEWMPGIDSCRVEGENRILETMGMTITEALVAKDDAARVLTYSIVDGVPIETHQGVVTVTPNGATTHVTWAVDALPDEMVTLLTTTYQAALDELKKRVEG
jgi:carbon monoxide dehydrogenase subunit G